MNAVGGPRSNNENDIPHIKMGGNLEVAARNAETAREALQQQQLPPRLTRTPSRQAASQPGGDGTETGQLYSTAIPLRPKACLG